MFKGYLLNDDYNPRERIDIKEGEIDAARKLGYDVKGIGNGEPSQLWQIIDPQGRKMIIYDASYMMAWQLIINDVRKATLTPPDNGIAESANE